MVRFVLFIALCCFVSACNSSEPAAAPRSNPIKEMVQPPKDKAEDAAGKLEQHNEDIENAIEEESEEEEAEELPERDEE